MHPERQRRTANLHELAARKHWEDYYRQLMLWEFPREARMGWQLAFLRPFAVPRMARILVQAGHLVHDPLKRAYDTGLIIYELVQDGIDGPRGRQMVAVMNRAHHGRAIEPEDMTYVLCAFIIAPLRYIERTGWRPLTSTDRQASLEFYSRMGRLMKIQHIPATYAEAEALYDDYEATMVAPSEPGAILGANLIKVLKGRLPAPGRPIASAIFTTLLDDRRVTAALGLQQPPGALRHLGHGATRLYGLIQRQRAPRTQPIFTPGMVAGKQYPHGYQLDQLGPPANH